MNMTDKEIEQRIGIGAELIERTLGEVAKTVPSLAAMARDSDLMTLERAERYSLMAGGKRIRPVLTLEVCRMLGGEDRWALFPACALEMVHTYSLIHDDLPCMDNDDLRRGKPTNHKMFGEAIAVLAGDGLLTDAFSVLAACPGLSAEAKLEAVRVLADAAGSNGMVGGQTIDLENEGKRISMETMQALHDRKTGCLMVAAVHLGALAAGLMPSQDREGIWMRLTTYATRIGRAFQVVDDLLDVTCDAAQLGKTPGKDQKECKNTTLSFYSPEQARRYADQLTIQACEAVAPYDKEGILNGIAHYLARRTH